MRKNIYFFLLVTVLTLSVHGEGDSVFSFTPRAASYNLEAYPKDPVASAFFSATIPGSGQVYNKEYARGAVTAALFYSAAFTVQVMLNRFEKLNTDTIYFEETNQFGEKTGKVRQVFIPKDENDVLGLPPGEKAVLGSAAIIAAATYVFAVVDAYKGASRHNERLAAKLALHPSEKGLGAKAVLKF
jgi:hypothetical protein